MRARAADSTFKLNKAVTWDTKKVPLTAVDCSTGRPFMCEWVQRITPSSLNVLKKVGTRLERRAHSLPCLCADEAALAQGDSASSQQEGQGPLTSNNSVDPELNRVPHSSLTRLLAAAYRLAKKLHKTSLRPAADCFSLPAYIYLTSPTEK
ncbi:hypothetical protein CROQUDRAFT_86174 [Cronartium quercuum f. sp. fusiforme G11]|uniref:Uncharacterized protein n=1 Tax=Cronartium quercuum f. sp. fusiforme G11 TaxID=708437 RepID=A0A9P6NU30_9BASI|nr:hypothetical protein CROQUDRAFT_86174 [Cronartium quercuum f. sp. fusiforme G11]